MTAVGIQIGITSYGQVLCGRHFHHFLMTTLHRAITLKEMQYIALDETWYRHNETTISW